jgi:TRAP-type mannitol/chloroaromatic compound transport system permease large subunit
MKKEVWFGLSIMAMVVAALFFFLPPPSEMSNGHLGLLMLGLIVIAIMLGFPTAFTLMGMGVIFSWFAYSSRNPDLAWNQTLDLMVQRTYAVMANDVLISIPLFVFMGYLVERANLIERLFRALQLAMVRIPGSLAVATIVTSAIFATATGIVGAVVTLMGLLALPGMLKAGYNVRLSAGSITAGGCLGILIPPSIMLIVYGATAGVSVVKLYAGAFFPGLMLAFLYVLYVVIVAKLKPESAPPLPESERHVPLSPAAQAIVLQRKSNNAFLGLLTALGNTPSSVSKASVMKQFFIALLPALVFAVAMGGLSKSLSAPEAPAYSMEGLEPMGMGNWNMGPSGLAEPGLGSGLLEPPIEDGLAEPLANESLNEPLSEPLNEPLSEPESLQETPAAVESMQEDVAATEENEAAISLPTGFWITLAIGVAALSFFYLTMGFAQLEIFKMLLTSFFPLAMLILAVLGSIVFGLATPSEAAAMGALGGLLLALGYRRLNFKMMKESVFLTAKTSAMVCWLFVGSSIFSAAFALLGGQELINEWVLSMDLTPIQFMLLAQVIIFLLGWPLEWTEIIVIFMPIFVPLLPHFGIDPLFFGLLVALNLQTAFLSPPVAMSAFYLKGVSPPHVTLNQIFLGMLPFMGIQVIAMILLYLFPAIGLWLPSVMYS